MRLLAIAIFAFFLVPVAGAQLYACPKAGGGSTLTSTPTSEDCQLQQSIKRGAERLKAQSVQPKQAPKLVPTQTKKKPAAKKSSKKYPVVSTATQKVRDKKRMEILLYELEKEEQQQQATREHMESINIEIPKQAELLPHFEEKLAIHSQNIIAIKQELARL